MTFTVRFRDQGGWLDFAHPRAVLRAADPAGAYHALERAQQAMHDGAWVAGVVPYELSGLVLGIFDAPARRASFESAHSAVSPLLPLRERARYDASVDAIRAAIYEGNVYQVNYTVPFAIGVEGDPFALFYRIATSTNARYQAYVEDGDRRILSWSPELFLAFRDGTLTASPMKGTAPRDDPSQLQSEKNRAEHVMIVDLLRNDLHRVCDRVRVEQLYGVEHYPAFSTMTSTIAGDVRNGATLADIFTAVFPCGSVTGAPKRAAMECIASLEEGPRGAYCGSIGFLSPEGNGWWNVAIRTAQLDGATGRFDVGGGIVTDSNADDEWREIHVKSAFLRDASSGSFELWETFAGDAAETTLQLHLDRLESAASRLDIPLRRADVLEAIAPYRRKRELVRLRVEYSGTINVFSETLPSHDVVPVCVSDARVRSDDPWLAVKSSWRPAHRAAWETAQRRSCFDALLQNERGEITEGSRTNVFVEIDGALCTPPVCCGVLPGVLRGQLLASGRAVERVVMPADLERAPAVYVGNSARGLMRAALEKAVAPP